MGTGHHKQQTFFKTPQQHRFSHGGELRKRKLRRGARPLSTKSPIHVVFKANRFKLRHRSLRASLNFTLINSVIVRYSKSFSIKVEQLSIQHDHIHILIRTSRRKNFQCFFRVVSGQIAQIFEKEGLLAPEAMTDLHTPKDGSQTGGLWKYRPFSRVVIGWTAYLTARNYIQLNEKEVLGKIKYQKNRLRGLSSGDWQILWS